MAKQKITVDGTTIHINQNNYISLTDIAKRRTNREPSQVIRGWLRNNGTISFLATWEKVHNPNFKPSQMTRFRETATDHSKKVSVQSFIEQTEAIGITSTSGRHSAVFAHLDIALNFCYGFPEFLLPFLHEIKQLKLEQTK